MGVGGCGVEVGGCTGGGGYRNGVCVVVWVWVHLRARFTLLKGKIFGVRSGSKRPTWVGICTILIFNSCARLLKSKDFVFNYVHE